MSGPGRFRTGLALVALLGLAARLHGIGWDGWQHLHPDERFLTIVSDAIRLPPPSLWFDTARSPANPHNAGQSFYVYGTLPLFLFRGIAAALGKADYDGLLRVQRGVATLADFATILLLGLLARRLAPPGAREKAGLLAAALWAAVPFAIQQARFGTVDTLGTAFVVAALLVSVTRRTPGGALLAGLLLGAAGACKVNLLVFGASLGLAFLLGAEVRRSPARLAACGALGILGALVAFRVLDPYAFRGPGLLGVAPNPAWLANLAELRGLLKVTSWYPPGVQWVDRPPIDFASSLLLWATGPLLGLWLAGASVALLHRALLGRREVAVRLLPVVAVAVPLLVWQSLQPVASVRHAHTALALLVAAGAAAFPLLLGRLARPAALAVLAGTALAGAAFLGIASREHTRLAASRWLGTAFPNGARVAFEYWDDALPLPLPDVPWEGFTGEALPVFEPDSPRKAGQVLTALARSEVYVLSSRRAFAPLSRLPDAYPWTSELYRLLDSGALGFEKAAVFESPPGIGPLRFDDRTAEEALSVYDHPVVTIYRRTSRFSLPLAERLLARVGELPPEPPDPATVEARGVPPDESPRARARGWPAPPPPRPKGLVGGAVAVAGWLLFVEVAGALAAGLLLATGSRPSLASGLGRPAGFALAGLLWLWLGSTVPGYPFLALPLVVAAAAAAWFTPAGRRGMRLLGRSRLLFLALFGGFLLVRAFNPEIFWGEKPMDGALLGAALRSPRLPLYEPWFDGAPLDYYAQGFLPVAFAARASGAWAGLAYNLACATLPAFLGGALFAIGRLLSGRRLGGFLALLLGLLSGTLAPLLNAGWRTAPFGFDGFWAASRVVPPVGIDEFPLFTALFADLHAHFLSWAPFAALLGLALGRTLRRPRAGSRADRGGALLLGALAGAVHLTNPWETPLAALLLLAALPPRRPKGEPLRAAAATAPFLLAGGAALLAALPSLLAVRTSPVGVELDAPHPGVLLPYVELYGLPVALLLLAWVVRGTGETRRERVALAVGLAGLLLVAGAEVVVVSDRMNTLFKFGLQARLLLSVGAAAAVPPLLSEARSRRLAVGIPLALAALLGAVTLVAGASHVVAVVRTRRVPGPRPALDGYAYVASWDPALDARGLSLGRRAGFPAILDPPGEPYSPSLQVTMRTGCPTLVGWPWHLVQRRRSPAQIALREGDVSRLLSGPRDELWARLRESYGLSAGDVDAAIAATAGSRRW